MKASHPPRTYHSALGPAISAPKVDRFEHRPSRSLAFAHDLLSTEAGAPLPAPFRSVDVLYAEPPWRDGFERFNKRAGIATPRTYADLLARLTGIIRSTDQPVVMTAGKHALRHLPKPDHLVPILLWGGNAYAVAYRTELPARTGTNLAAIEHLADTYDSVGDFVCGYGVTGEAFARRGKRFVLSDYNPMCIGYIAGECEKWFP